MSASQPEPLTPQSQTSLQQFKLRSSCDACGQAKIKCDRGQPACARCVAQGVSCVYGVSRKAGKPPRRRPAAPSPLPSRPVEPETTSVDLTGTGHDGIDMMLGLEGSMAIDSPFSASDAAFQTWFPFDSFGSPGALRAASSDGDTCMSGQSGSSTTASTTATSVAAGRPYCTQEAKGIMRRLYCANPSALISDGMPARILDLGSVLTRNRDVVARLGMLLNCPCARSPHTAMLYSSIVSRVLLWYQQAACNVSTTGVSSSFPPMLAGLATQDTLPSLSTSTTLKAFDAGTGDDSSSVSVLPTPVTVGSFQSEDRRVQTALTNCLILSELRKVGSLIDSFISLGTAASDLQNTGDACPAAGEFSANMVDANLFASLGGWLQTEHRRIVRKARSGISVLDENLGF
ncbi:hypothetical protein B0T10DRAFT_565871 [Thelonectria olida]|uniref:Zn(2)-C6 fungal-type domain-containing protein n=1 Tax=Thelonectria olida TaxID=1576542 RepID=A0A9P8VVN4_9HYPO|nr:hypothetical protein B0T10DRAFT_565871 [Thelonectria olida]